MTRRFVSQLATASAFPFPTTPLAAQGVPVDDVVGHEDDFARGDAPNELGDQLCGQVLGQRDRDRSAARLVGANPYDL